LRELKLSTTQIIENSLDRLAPDEELFKPAGKRGEAVVENRVCNTINMNIDGIDEAPCY
jgi:hypothetical protein